MINLTIPLSNVLTSRRQCSAARLGKMIPSPLKVLFVRDYHFDSKSNYWIRLFEMRLGQAPNVQQPGNALNDF